VVVVVLVIVVTIIVVTIIVVKIVVVVVVVVVVSEGKRVVVCGRHQMTGGSHTPYYST